MKRLTAEIEEWVLEALKPYDSEREWTWDLSLTLSPNGAMLMIYLDTPGIVLGTTAMSVVLANLPVDKKTIQDGVVQQVQAINEQMAEALQIPSNGSEPPVP